MSTNEHAHRALFLLILFYSAVGGNFYDIDFDETKSRVDIFQSAFNRSGECLTGNAVLPRHDGINGPNIYPVGSFRPWSIHNRTVYSNGQDLCTTNNALLASLYRGARRWDSNVSQWKPFEKEVMPSYFEPFACNPRYFSPWEACSVLQAYSGLLLLGDSLTRHVLQAFGIVLSGNLEYGGTGKRVQPDYYDKCRCDGQFSEALECREPIESATTTLQFDDNRQSGYCAGPKSRKFSLRLFRDWPKKGDVCTESDYRPLCVYISYGAHIKFKANKTMNYVRSVVGRLRSSNKNCPKKRLVILWGGMSVQSRLLDSHYPHQSREQVKVFNEITSRKMAEEFQVESLDWFNLTAEAPKSDGFHSLTDVNLLKAMYILHYMSLQKI